MRIAPVLASFAALLAAAPAMQAQTVKTTLNYPVGVTGVAINHLANRAYVLLPDFEANGSNAV